MTKVIAEIGLAHEGSIKGALLCVEKAADAGAWGVKFQWQDPDRDLAHGHPWTRTMRRCRLSESELLQTREYAKELGLRWGFSAFSEEGYDYVLDFTYPDFVKIGGATAQLFFADTDLVETPWDEPTLVSVGCGQERLFQDFDEYDRTNITLLWCSSVYPSSPEDSGMASLAQWVEGAFSRWGLSDHSGRPYAGLAAAALGAEYVEVHFPACGPDKQASLTQGELRMLCSGVDWINRAMESTEVRHDQHVIALATHGQDGRRG